MPFFVPNPPRGSQSAEEAGGSVEVSERRVRTRDVDFARAFEESQTRALRDSLTAALLSYEPFTFKTRPVRVMIKRNVNSAEVSSPAEVLARTNGGTTVFKSRIHFEAGGQNSVSVKSEGNSKRSLNLPCTLVVNDPFYHLSLGDAGYRGALVIISENEKTISFVNVLDVEDYLRGVVPREIGVLNEAEIEAVKAQAVAARTYAYKKMGVNHKNKFDLVSTVADQVYGGANAEHAVSDAAVARTKDIIMVYDNEIAGAYYHSTCGGKTANIEDVWSGAAALPYLRSINDADNSGNIYCVDSRAFAWEESWNAAQLGKILTRFHAEGNLSAPFKGNLRKVEVKERFACGRVKSCSIISSGGSFQAGGDKVRFLFRKDAASYPILRSSNFEVENSGGAKIVIKGRGYGHGIGMCQTGAIGRAKAGQDFHQILKAYYSGVTLRAVASQ
ncbi:MAG: SpoIID/LytB domain-containing protein [Chitinispirillales bacterium]|jgi:stage II sporulation protein D|nr:SpoIID/LytB domain-containing protein [Chitinispirillales bacterium]